MKLLRSQLIPEINLALKDRPYVKWANGAHAPNGLLAFNFDKKYEKDKIGGFIRVDSLPDDEEVAFTYRSTRMLGGFVLKTPDSDIRVFKTELFHMMHLQNSGGGLLLITFNGAGKIIRPDVDQSSLALMAGHLIEVANVGYLAKHHAGEVS